MNGIDFDFALIEVAYEVLGADGTNAKQGEASATMYHDKRYENSNE
jgi:hypothetical protein